MIPTMGGIFQRDGVWYHRFRVGKRLVRKSLRPYGITTEAQAKAYLRQVERDGLAKRLAELDPSTRTLEQLRAEYVAHRHPLGIAADTLRKDDQALRSLAGHLGENFLLRSITNKKVEQWAGTMLTRGVAPTTVNSYLRHIRAALNTAVEWRWLEKAPKLKSVKEPTRAPRALTAEEMDRILDKEKNPERRALWEFCLWTGLRRQEALDLTWQDVHLVDKPYLRVVGKGDKEGFVPLLPQAVQALAVMPTADVGPVWRFHFRGYKNPKPVTGSPVSRWFKAAARRAGIEDAHLHDLRHTAATWMAARGVPERIIQEIMRHANITTTQIYTRGVARVADLYTHMATGLVSQK